MTEKTANSQTNQAIGMSQEQIQQYLDKMKEQQKAYCPNCGYCPHCGRGGNWFYPANPYIPYWQRPYIWKIDTTTVTY
jgi:sulfatase maturation enzyme AslB (radical SAM superfamily)